MRTCVLSRKFTDQSSLGEWRAAVGLRRADRGVAQSRSSGNTNAGSRKPQRARNLKFGEWNKMKLNQISNVAVRWYCPENRTAVTSFGGVQLSFAVWAC